MDNVKIVLNKISLIIVVILTIIILVIAFLLSIFGLSTLIYDVMLMLNFSGVIPMIISGIIALLFCSSLMAIIKLHWKGSF